MAALLLLLAPAALATAPVFSTGISATLAREGSPVEFSVTATDLEGPSDTLTFVWDFGDSSTAATTSTKVTHTFADDGDFTVEVTVNDAAAEADFTFEIVTIDNETPVIQTLDVDATATEGETLTFSVTASDAAVSMDTLTFTWSFGDGDSASGATVTHAYADDGDFTVLVAVNDESYGAVDVAGSDPATLLAASEFAAAAAVVAVDNAAPAIVSLDVPAEPEPDTILTFSVTATDAAGSMDTLTFSWSFGDGDLASGSEVTHSYTSEGDFTVLVTVNDEDGDDDFEIELLEVEDLVVSPSSVSALSPETESASVSAAELSAPPESETASALPASESLPNSESASESLDVVLASASSSLSAAASMSLSVAPSESDIDNSESQLVQETEPKTQSAIPDITHVPSELAGDETASQVATESAPATGLFSEPVLSGSASPSQSKPSESPLAPFSESPAAPSPAEASPTPVEPSSTPTPADPTPAEPSSTPAEPTSAEPSSSPVAPSDAPPSSSPVPPSSSPSQATVPATASESPSGSPSQEPEPTDARSTPSVQPDPQTPANTATAAASASAAATQSYQMTDEQPTDIAITDVATVLLSQSAAASESVLASESEGLTPDKPSLEATKFVSESAVPSKGLEQSPALSATPTDGSTVESSGAHSASASASHARQTEAAPSSASPFSPSESDAAETDLETESSVPAHSSSPSVPAAASESMPITESLGASESEAPVSESEQQSESASADPEQSESILGVTMTVGATIVEQTASPDPDGGFSLTATAAVDDASPSPSGAQESGEFATATQDANESGVDLTATGAAESNQFVSGTPTSDSPATESRSPFQTGDANSPFPSQSSSASSSASASTTGKPGESEFASDPEPSATAEASEAFVSDPPAAVPTELTSAQFDATGNSIEVGFTTDTNRAASSDCTGLIEVDASYGESPSCAWRDAVTLVVELGVGATIVPGDIVSVAENTIIFNAADTLPATGVAEILAPDMPPTVVLSVVAPTVVARCARVFIDARSSTGSGGRDFVYEWALEDIVAADGVTVTGAELTFINQRLSESGSTVEFGEDELTPGVTLTISLAVINFLGGEADASIVVEKSTEAIPTVLIGGGSFVSVKISQRGTLNGDIELPSCVDADSGMYFSWSLLSGPSAVTLNEKTQSSKKLTLDAFSMDVTGDTLYTYQLVGCALGTNSTVSANSTGIPEGANCNTATQMVEVTPEDLIASISGGSLFLAGPNSDVMLDGSLSSDPNNAAGDLAFSWSCSYDDGASDCTSQLDDPTSATPTFATGSDERTYDFDLQVSKLVGEETLTADALTSIEVVDGTIVEVRITPPDAVRPSPSQVLRLATTGYTSETATYMWTQVLGDDLGLDDPDAVTSGTASNLFVVEKNVMLPDHVYRVRYEVTDIGGERGASEFEFTSNKAPFGGEFLVEPTEGESLNTEFTFEARNWGTFDFNLPLTYMFGYIKSDGGEEILATATTSFTDATIVLPPGELNGNEEIEAVAYIIDANGNQRRVTQTIGPVAALEFASPEDAIALASATVDAQVAEALAIGDVDRVNQLLSITNDILAANGARRSSRRACDGGVETDEEAARRGSFEALVDANGATDFATSLEANNNFQQYRNILNAASLSEQLVTEAEAHLASLADDLLSIGVEDGTGSILAETFESMISVTSECERTGLAQLVADGRSAIKGVARAAVLSKLCGERAYTTESSTFSSLGFRECSAATSFDDLEVDATQFVRLTSAVVSQFTDPEVFVTSQSIRPFDAPSASGTTTLSIELEQDGEDQTVSDVSEPFTFRMSITEVGEKETVECAFYDEASGDLSTEGCTTVEVTETYVECQCSHMTDFAGLLVDLPETESEVPETTPASGDDDDNPAQDDDDDSSGNIVDDGSTGGGGGGSDTGTAVGASLGAIGGVLIIAGLVVLVMRRRKANQLAPGAAEDDAPPPAHGADAWDDGDGNNGNNADADAADPPLRAGAGDIPAVPGDAGAQEAEAPAEDQADGTDPNAVPESGEAGDAEAAAAGPADEAGAEAPAAEAEAADEAVAAGDEQPAAEAPAEQEA